MTERQLAELLAKPAASYPAFTDVLIDLEILTDRVVLEEQNAYRRKMSQLNLHPEEETLIHRANEAVGADA